jgi:hypothetical protein
VSALTVRIDVVKEEEDGDRQSWPEPLHSESVGLPAKRLKRPPVIRSASDYSSNSLL